MTRPLSRLYSFLQLSLPWFLSPERPLELTWRLSRAITSFSTLLLELERYKDTVRGVALVPEVPGHRQQQLTQTLIVRLLKTHFCYTDP